MKKYRILILLLIVLFCAALAGCEKAYSLKFKQEEQTVISGIEFAPEVKVRPKKAGYELSSGNITIAKIKDKTTIITLREGIVEITATSGEMTAKMRLIISNDIDFDSDNIKFADTATISFVITNYQEAKLASENYGAPISVVKGGYANFVDEPYIKGYIVHHWYLDRACTVRFDENKEITSDLTLYAYLEQREQSYIVTNGFIAGVTYDNLPHAVLDLPATTENGTQIVGIADNAFKGDAVITAVNIPHTYKSIGDSAFAGCSNLTAVNFVGGESRLEVVGIAAFGALLNKSNTEIAWCGKLETFDLPDSVYEIGAYAFYKCSKLALDGIPAGLEVISQYAFAYTKINNVNLINVDEILEGAFKMCSSLNTVTNAHNVTRCYKDAFDGSLLYQNAKAAYNGSNPKNEALAVFYADTIAIGVIDGFGYVAGTGSGEIRLKTGCTLIADNAFYGDKLNEITLYLTTANASNAITTGNYDFLGKNLMKMGVGTNIVVPQTLVNTYKTRYPSYKNILCYEDVLEVSETESVNRGTHRILVFEDDNHAKTYYYKKYTGNATYIDLNTLGNYAGATYRRIGSFAFSNLADLYEINLGRVERIAPLAITSSCVSLTRIVLTSNSTPPTLENANSFQIASLEWCRIFVREGDLPTYRTAWADFTTAYTNLRKAE